MAFLKYAFLEMDFATAVLVVEKESNALVYASLGTSRTCMPSETRSSFGKLAFQKGEAKIPFNSARGRRRGISQEMV